MTFDNLHLTLLYFRYFLEFPIREQILAYYDKFAGLILDEDGNKIENGQFWKEYQKKLARQQKWEERWDQVKKWILIIGKYLVGILISLVVAYLIYKFGWNK